MPSIHKHRNKMGKNKLKRVHKPVRSVMRKPYTQRLSVFNKNTIGDYLRPKWHREFRENHIRIIKNGIMRGNHFSESITVNDVNGKLYVLNGNHRIEALRRIIKLDPKFSIEATVTKYENLDREGELNVYETINRSRPETALDRIKARCVDCYFVKNSDRLSIRPLFRKRGPGEVNSMTISVMVMPYHFKSSSQFSGGGAIPEYICGLDSDDMDKMERYYSFYRKVFGDITNENLYSHSTLFVTLGKIYYNNVDITLSEKDFKERIEVFKLRHTGKMMQVLSQGNSYVVVKEFYDLLLKTLSSRKKLFDITKVNKDGEKAD